MSEPEFKPGLEGVTAGETAVAEVTQTGLAYRGYDIADLAENTTFEEVAHLLLYGELPNSAQLSEFKTTLARFRELPDEVVRMMRMIPADVPIHLSPVHGELDPRELAEWIVEDHLPVRLQLQLHKFIWDPEARGV